MDNSRQLSFEILNKIQKNGAFSNIILDTYLEKEKPDIREKKYISLLVYGVTERQKTLDYNLSLYLRQPLKKLKPEVLTILRMGAYQLLFTDKIPHSAAVNESVKLTKSNKCAFASGLVNAVLRNISKNGLVLPEERDENRLSVEYSCEKWICDEWISHFGIDNTKRIFENSFGQVPVYIRVNSLASDTLTVKERLEKEGFEVKGSEDLPFALKIEKGGNPALSKSYEEGLFHVQDLSSQICCELTKARRDSRILDVCAAPGGKSFTMAQMAENTGEIISCDIYPHRLKLIEEGAKRLKLKNIHTLENDASKENNSIGKFDTVLCDAPCSGLGIIRRKPEIRYKSKEDIDKLKVLQYHILCTTSNYVSDKGRLIYSTCSLNREENENISKRFLKEHSDFLPVKIESFSSFGRVEENMLTVLPFMKDTDGFFISVFEKK